MLTVFVPAPMPPADGSVGVVTEKEAIAAELLAISHPLAFLEGSMGVAPPVEDLQVCTQTG